MARQVIPLNHLAEMLANRAGISYDEARQFILQYFEAINYGLVSGSEVSIKGFGSFIRISDTEAPVSFVPDEKLAKTLNAPFEAFSPIPIQNDVEFPQSNGTLQDGAATETEAAKKQEIVADVTPETELRKDIDEPGLVTESVQPDETGSAIHSEDATTNNVTPDNPDEDGTAEVIIADTDSVSDNQPANENVEDDTLDDYQDNDIEEHAEVYILPRHKCRTLFWCAISIAIGLIGGIAIGYYFHDKIAGYVTCDDERECALVPVMQAVETDTASTIVNTDKSDTTDITKPHTVSTEEGISKHEPRYDVVTSRQFLTTLAGKYYGVKDYWVYIYEANKAHLRHPDRIKPGTRILIPEISEYFADPTPSEANIKQARNLAAQIYARYK